MHVVFSERKSAKRMKHIGSAHSESELALLRAEAQRIVDGDQLAMDFGEVTHTPPATGSVSNPLPVAGQRAGYLLDCIDACFNELGLAAASGDDPVLRVLVRARIIHPSSKLDFIETLAEVGITSASYRTIQRRRSSFATESFGEIQTQALAHNAGIGPGAFILYDVTILYGAVAKLGGEPRTLLSSSPGQHYGPACLDILEDPVDDRRVRVRVPVGKHRALPFPQ